MWNKFELLFIVGPQLKSRNSIKSQDKWHKVWWSLELWWEMGQRLVVGVGEEGGKSSGEKLNVSFIEVVSKIVAAESQL